MNPLTTCLWFNGQAEEAMKFYTSVFKDSRVGTVTRYGGAGAEVSGQAEGSVMTATFTLNGQLFMALNGGPQFPHSEAVSLIVTCDTQEDIDDYWRKLSEGGSEGPCGWLKDRFGFSWQVVPKALGQMMSGGRPGASERVMKALVQMKKLDLARLQRAYEGPE